MWFTKEDWYVDAPLWTKVIAWIYCPARMAYESIKMDYHKIKAKLWRGR